jgi:ribosomal protein L37AE/L43A|tara:strand:+ start:63320 stop:63517 length:198 start_codon:yes stop_codon:yes gene_type:complete
MSNNQNLDKSVKFRPDYKWPEAGSKRDCPKCSNPLQLQTDLRDYNGKPWWCHTCQWQFSEGEFNE